MKSDAYRKLPSGAKAVLDGLWEMADTPRGWDPWVHGRAKVRTMAAYAGLGDRQTAKWLQRLRADGWIQTATVKGRFLAFTVFSTPNASVKAVSDETVNPSDRVLSGPKDRTEVRLRTAPKCASEPHASAVEVRTPVRSDIPPELSTFTNSSSSSTASDDAGASSERQAERGGGGDSSSDPDPTNRKAVREILTKLGCRPADVDRLADRVLTETDGLARLRSTIANLGRVASPIAVVAYRIRNGTLDELTPTELADRELDMLADEIRRRGYGSLGAWFNDVVGHADEATPIPPGVRNLRGDHGEAARDAELAKLRELDVTARNRRLASWERAMFGFGDSARPELASMLA